MASTNKTETLELSQFLGTDKPAWLTDYNGDMLKIDNGVKALQEQKTDTDAEIQELKDKDTALETSIKANADAITANTELITNTQTTQTNDEKRITTLETNYDTIHHELATAQEDITDLQTEQEELSGEIATLEADTRSIGTSWVYPISAIDITTIYNSEGSIPWDSITGHTVTSGEAGYYAPEFAFFNNQSASADGSLAISIHNFRNGSLVFSYYSESLLAYIPSGGVNVAGASARFERNQYPSLLLKEGDVIKVGLFNPKTPTVQFSNLKWLSYSFRKALFIN